MLKKFKKFLYKCNEFVNVYSHKIDNIDSNITLIQNEEECLKGDINYQQKELVELQKQVDSLNQNINQLLSYFDCVNLEYLNLDNTIKKTRVLLVGFYGAPNLGDELMLNVLFMHLVGYENQIDLTVMMSENYNFDLTRYPKCKVIHYPKNIMDINVIANYYDEVIFGGGALLDDSDYDLNNLSFSLNKILVNLAYRMITMKKKVIMYGLSSNDCLNNDEYITKLNYIACNASYFSLRDINSLCVLNNSGIDTSKIKIVDDLVFSYDCSKYLNYNSSNLVKNIGLIYICNDETFESLCNITRLIIQYCNSKEQNYKITMIPFYEYLNNDTNYYKKIKDSLGEENIEVLNYPFPIENIFKIISEMDLCVSMRYHGTLISNMMGVPTLNLFFNKHRHYKNKVDYLYSNYNFENYKLDFFDFNENSFEELFKTVYSLEKNDNIDKKIYNKANEQIRDVIKNFVDLEEVVKK